MKEHVSEIQEYLSQFDSMSSYDGFKERLLEELRDHVEDSLHDAYILNQQSTPMTLEKNVLENMGDPVQIKKDFTQAMKQKNSFSAYANSLLWGLVAVPMMQIVFFILNVSLLNIQSFLNIQSLEIPSGLFYSVVTGAYAGLLTVVWSVYFLLTITKNFRLSGQGKTWFHLFLLILPSVVILYWALTQPPVPLISFEFAHVEILIMILSACLAYWIAWSFYRRQERFAITSSYKKFQQITKIITFLLSIVLIIIIFITNSFDYTYYEKTSLSQFRYFLLTFRNIFDIGLHESFFYVVIGRGYDGFYLIFSFYVLLSTLCLWEMVKFLRNRSFVKHFFEFPWMKLVFVVYAYSLFFLVSVPSVQEGVQFQVPYTEVSDDLRKKEHNIMYRFIDYLLESGYVANLGMFEVGDTSNTEVFKVRMLDVGAAVEYQLNPQIDSLEEFTIKKMNQNPEPIYYFGKKPLPKELECLYKDQLSSLYIDQFFDEGDTSWYCEKMKYNGKELFNQKVGLRLLSFDVIGQDNEFALVRFLMGNNSVHYLFLLDLSSLN